MGFFGHASFGEGILVGFFFFCGFLPFVLFCLVCCFLFCFVFSIDYATEVQDMLSLQWCLDGTLYYIAHCNCEAGWVRVDKLWPFKIVVGDLTDVPTLIFYIALDLGITKHFCCFLINLLLLATFFFCWSMCWQNYFKKTVDRNINPHWTGNLIGHHSYTQALWQVYIMITSWLACGGLTPSVLHIGVFFWCSLGRWRPYLTD